MRKVGMNEVPRELERLSPFLCGEAEGRAQYVLSQPPARGSLTEEEYAPIHAAAEAKTRAYMCHGDRGPADGLRFYVMVKGTVVAYILHDGVPRVIARDFGDPMTNRVRDMARLHLGAGAAVRTELADDRGDVERMTAEGFRGHIWRNLDRCSRGSRFNDFPPGPLDTRGPNPTVEYPEEQRREWAAKAVALIAKFRERYPAEYAAWEEREVKEAQWARQRLAAKSV